MQVNAVAGTSRLDVQAAYSRLSAARTRLAADQATGADDYVIRNDKAVVAAGQLQVAESRRGIVLDVLA